MSDDIKWRQHQNLKSLKLKNKAKYYCDLQNIEHSWSGRMDCSYGNTFIMESEQLLINAIELFEMGYFDCAYYSLRSAIDISITMVFLSDIPDKDNYLKDWEQIKPFPLRKVIIDKLKEDGTIFVDMLKKMPTFFIQAKKLNEQLNKYVHKQGLDNFYVFRNHPIMQDKSQDAFINNFETYLKKCISVIAVMRLAIDPFPILLMDEDILYRCFDSMTNPYTDEFVNEYIGITILQEYKNTDFYSSIRQLFKNEEKKNYDVFNIVKNRYIKTQKFDNIFKQIHLLNGEDLICTSIAYICEKAVKIYACDGLLVYNTDRKSNRESLSLNTQDFVEFQNTQNKLNQKYDKTFISVFQFNKDFYFVEHNVELTFEDYSKTINYIEDVLNKLEK